MANLFLERSRAGFIARTLVIAMIWLCFKQYHINHDNRIPVGIARAEPSAWTMVKEAVFVMKYRHEESVARKVFLEVLPFTPVAKLHPNFELYLDEIPNAFAVTPKISKLHEQGAPPMGVYLASGMYEMMDTNSDELANILGHELGHITTNDFVSKNDAGQRILEYRADHNGQLFAKAAGFDPCGGSRMMLAVGIKYPMVAVDTNHPAAWKRIEAMKTLCPIVNLHITQEEYIKLSFSTMLGQGLLDSYPLGHDRLLSTLMSHTIDHSMPYLEDIDID